jgi:transcriptional regulator with XRE-family HTH domain
MQAERMGISRQRLSEMERGNVPAAFLYLIRLAELERIDLNLLLLGRNGA